MKSPKPMMLNTGLALVCATVVYAATLPAGLHAQDGSAGANLINVEIISLKPLNRPLLGTVPEDLIDSWNYFSVLHDKIDEDNPTLSTEEERLDRDITVMEERIEHAREFHQGLPRISGFLQRFNELTQQQIDAISDFIVKYRDVWTDLAFFARVEPLEEGLSVTAIDATQAKSEIDEAITLVNAILVSFESGNTFDAEAWKPSTTVSDVRIKVFREIHFQLTSLRELAAYDGVGDLPDPQKLHPTLLEADSKLTSLLDKSDRVLEYARQIRQEHSENDFTVKVLVANYQDVPVAVSAIGTLHLKESAQGGRSDNVELVSSAIVAGSESSSAESQLRNFLGPDLDESALEELDARIIVDHMLIPPQEAKIVNYETRGMTPALNQRLRAGVYIDVQIFPPRAVYSHSDPVSEKQIVAGSLTAFTPDAQVIDFACRAME